MFVMTVDQRGSRRDIDRVDAVLDTLADTATVRPFERTAGDEIQAVLDDPTVVARLCVQLSTDGHWSVGVGVGVVEQPLPESTRAGRGPAFEFAREAVDAAKSQRIPLAVRGADTRRCTHAQTAARLVADVITQRSEQGTEAVTLMRSGITQSEAAQQLGISPQAMSQRLRSARWDIEDDGYALLADLLATANETTT
ncbi:hypothetical protein AAFP30_12820 [Gordonia sp. CPCC 205515]|uniref:hypothetical protein n=1 Tax=Gordonia sp. CPCC 205515 TaxID=3140791 RepID=UPI003AF3F479